MPGPSRHGQRLINRKDFNTTMHSCGSWCKELFPQGVFPFLSSCHDRKYRVRSVS
jgi:hypothetical protein